MRLQRMLDIKIFEGPPPAAKSYDEDQSRRQALRSFGTALGTIIRRICRGKEVFDSLAVALKERAYDCMQKIGELLRQLQSAIAPPTTARARAQHKVPFRPAQADVLLRGNLLTLQQRVTELIDLAGPAGLPQQPDLAAAAAAAAEGGLDAAAVRECHEAAATLADIYDRAAAIAPAEALRTLVAARRQFGSALLRRMGVTGNRIAADLFEARLRALFTEFDLDRSGWIDRPRMAAAMVALGVAMSGAYTLSPRQAPAAAIGKGFVDFKSRSRIFELAVLTAQVIQYGHAVPMRVGVFRIGEPSVRLRSSASLWFRRASGADDDARDARCNSSN